MWQRLSRRLWEPDGDGGGGEGMVVGGDIGKVEEVNGQMVKGGEERQARRYISNVLGGKVAIKKKIEVSAVYPLLSI